MSTWVRRGSHGLHRNSPVFRERMVDAGPLPMPADVQMVRAPVANAGLLQAQPVTLGIGEPDDLLLGQKMVLLKLRKGELAAAILEKLSAMSAPEPSGDDWRAMIEARYVRRNYATSAGGRLELMPAGLAKVGAIMRDLAPKYNIHLFKRIGGRGTHSGAQSFCSCGWSTGPHRLTRNVEFVVARHETYHLDMVEAGTWKRPRPLHEFLNEIAPPSFNFSAAPGRNQAQ